MQNNRRVRRMGLNRVQHMAHMKQETDMKLLQQQQQAQQDRQSLESMTDECQELRKQMEMLAREGESPKLPTHQQQEQQQLQIESLTHENRRLYQKIEALEQVAPAPTPPTPPEPTIALNRLHEEYQHQLLQQRATLVIQKICRQHMARTKRKQDVRLLSIVQCARHKDRASMQDLARENTGLKATIARHKVQHASNYAILSNQYRQELQHQRDALIKEHRAAAATTTTPATSTKPPSSKSQPALAKRLKVSLRSAMERNRQAQNTIASMKSEILALKQANRNKTKNEVKELQERVLSNKVAQSVQQIAMLKENSEKMQRCSGGGSGGGWTTPANKYTSPRLQVSPPGHTRTSCSAPVNDDVYLDHVEASVNEAILVSIALQKKQATEY